MSYSKGIEALARAIAAFNGSQDPGSDLFHANNPGGLIATSPDHLEDWENNRIFRSFLDGWQALLHDLEVKLTRPDSRAQLNPQEDTLVDLAKCFVRYATHLGVRTKVGNSQAKKWAEFLRKALKDPDITHDTKLERFLK